MSYIAVDLDKANNAAAIGPIVGCTQQTILGGFVNLLIYCLRTDSAVVSTTVLNAQFGLTPDRKDLTAALEAFNEIGAVENGNWFFMEANELLARKKVAIEAKSKAAQTTNKKRWKRPASDTQAIPERQASDSEATVERQPSDTPASQNIALTPNTYHLTPNTFLKDPASQENTPPPKAKKKSLSRKETEKPPDPRHAPTVKQCCDVFREEIGSDYAFSPREAKTVTELLARGTPEEIVTRWRRALRHKKFPEVRSLLELHLHWNRFATATAEDMPPSQAPPSKPCAACRTTDGYMGEVWGHQLCANCQFVWRSSDCQPNGAATAAWIQTRQNGAASHG